jgi:hypothetical protein
MALWGRLITCGPISNRPCTDVCKFFKLTGSSLYGSGALMPCSLTSDLSRSLTLAVRLAANLRWVASPARGGTSPQKERLLL